MSREKFVSEKQKELGSRIRQLREQKGLNAKQLGALCNPTLSGPTITRIETGKIPDPGIDTIRRIATALEMLLPDLLGEVPSGSATVQSLVSGLQWLDGFPAEGLHDLRTIVESNDEESLEGILSSLQAYARSVALLKGSVSGRTRKGRGGER